MITATFIAQRFVELLTILASIFFLYRTLNTKAAIKKQIAIGILYICIRMFYYYMGWGYNPYFALISGVIYSHFIFSGKFRTHLIWNIIPIVIDGIVDVCVINVYLLFPGSSEALVDADGPVHIFISIIAKLLLCAIYYIATINVDKSDIMEWKDSMYLFFSPIGCWVILEIFFRQENIFSQYISNFLITVVSLVLLLIIISVVISYNQIAGSIRRVTRSNIQLRILEMSKEHTNQINELYTQLASVQHDLHNHFYIIKGYIRNKNYDELENYITSLADIETDTKMYARHPVLNTLIGTKAVMAKTTAIEFTTDINMPDYLPVNDVDLCILISNILDNAFDACCGAPALKYIRLTTRTVGSYWGIACKNSTRTKGRFRSMDNLKSTKDSKAIHGIGTTEIKQIAEKTGGFVSFSHEDYEFSALVMLKL